MALKQSPQGASNAARWQGSHAGEPVPAASCRDDTVGGNFLLPIQEGNSHTHLQLKLFLTFLKLCSVGFPAQG